MHFGARRDIFTQHQEWLGITGLPTEWEPRWLRQIAGCGKPEPKIIMYLQKLFAQKLKGISYKDIAKQLGYQNAENCASKIQNLLSSPYLGLEDSGYDFKYSTDEFIVELAELLGIPNLLIKKVIEEIQVDLLAQSQKFHSYIFVETFFRRKGQPIFALAFMEGARHINIQKEIRHLSLDRQLCDIQSLIRNHYHRTNGELPVWGTIARYVLYYEKDLTIEFSPSGKIINASKNMQRKRLP